MAYPARETAICSECGAPINIGDMITWSRRDKGRRIHVACWEKTHPASSSKDDAVAQRISELESLIGKMTEMMSTGIPAAVAVADKKPDTVIKKRAALKDNAQWWQILETIINWANDEKEYVRVLLIGPPGTGKSTTALKVAGIKGEYRMTFNEKMSIEDCIGMMHLLEGEKGVKTGFVPIKITNAMRNGEKMLWDEVDHHSPEVSSALYGWLDDDPHVTLPDGKTEYAAKGYGIVATTNSNVTSLTEAVFDRFDVVLQAIEPHPDALAMLPTEQMRAAVKNRFKSLDKAPWTWSGQASLRRMRSFARFAPVIGEVNASVVAFGTAGKELLGVICTAARSAATPSSL